MKANKEQILEQIKIDALEELKRLYDCWDGDFTSPQASPDKPLSYRIVYAIWSDTGDAIDEALIELNGEEYDLLLAWFKKQATEILWDRVSKIDWETKEKSRQALLRTLSQSLGIK